MLSLTRKILVFCALLLTATVAWGQTGSGSVRGTVQDPTKAIIPGVEVVLTNVATNLETRTKSNEAGLYVFPAVLPGGYKIAAQSPGMQKFEATVTVQVQQSVTIDITLSPATTQTVISVQDVTPMVTTDSPALGHVLERQRIEQLPINGRNVMNLLWTVPGLTTDSGGSWRTYGTRVGTHDVMLDGSALTDAVYGGGTVTRPPSLDSIQEFKVEVNSSSAKFARQTSIIMTTKGGTNEIHGTLFETNRNNGMGVARSRDSFTKAPLLIRNEYGGTVGGPVWLPKVYDGRNKTFWFVAYEGFKQRAAPIGQFRVPTQAMRDGDFSGLVDSAGTRFRVYNPFATDPVTFQRPQFSYQGVLNRIDPALQAPLSKYFNQVVPLPTLPDVNPLVANNYFGPRPDKFNQWTLSARFDHQFSEKDHVYVRLTQGDSVRSRLAASGVPLADNLGNSRIDLGPNKSISGNWAHSFSPSFFNEFMFSASRSVTGLWTGEPGKRYADMLGLPNPNNQVGFPVINNIGVGAGASNYFQPVNARSQWFNYFILDNNATKIIGRHELQFGAHLRYDQLTYLPQQQQSGGSVSFAAVATALYDPTRPLRDRGVLNTGHIAASAYIGAANYTYRVVKSKYYMRQNEDALYLQDNFRLTSRLTLNLGLRWQFSPYPKDKYDIFSSFDPKTMSIVLGNTLDMFYKVGATSPGLINLLTSKGAKFAYPQDVGMPKRLVTNKYFDIGPHVGFAYRALDGPKSFVIRGGFSTSYFPVPIYGWNDRMRINAPFTAIYQAFPLTAADQSPDGLPNYGLISAPTIIAGKNSSTAITLDNPRGITIGGDSFQAAYFNPDQPSSRVHDWNLTLEKEVMSNTIVRAAYFGNYFSHQDSYDNWNETIPAYVWYMTRKERLPTGEWSSALRRPNPTYPYGDLQEYRRDGWGNSNGVQLEVERRYNAGIGFQLFYVLTNVAKAAGHGWYSDSMVSPVSSFLPGSIPEDHRARMKTLLYMRDITIPKHEVRWNWIADLPFGKGKTLGRNSNRFLDAVIGGWQVTGMGRLRSTYFTLPTGIWPTTGNPIEYYGHKYPIQDCRSGTCVPGYLMWNGYIPAHVINSYDANGKPNGVMGVPSNYKPAAQPLFPYPADYRSRNAQNDPIYGYYGSNTVFIRLNDGTTQEVALGSMHPWRNQPLTSTRVWGCDAALMKNFRITEQVKLRVQADFFNVFNVPGNEFSASSEGLVMTNYNVNSPRTLQLSGRLSW